VSFSPETLLKMSLAKKGKKLSDDHKKKISEANKGDKAHWFGKKMTDEARQNMSLAGKGRKQSPEHIKNATKTRIGNKSHLYIDGRSKNLEHRRWIKNKRNRDKRSVSGSHTFGEWEDLKAKYNWTCPRCKKQEPVIKLTQDHIIPVSKGGSDNIENIQPLCQKCNSWKMTKIIIFNP
jgi:5-methylcytosine-specific restriction endonuclease McrA